MKSGKTLFTVCLSVSVICLARGYALSGSWIGGAVALLSAPAWLLARRSSGTWPANVCLAGSVALAVLGILSGAPALLMICEAGFSLILWDFLLFNNVLGSDTTHVQTGRYESGHLLSLALALVPSLVVAVLGRYLKLQIPFVILILSIALALFGLDRAWMVIRK